MVCRRVLLSSLRPFLAGTSVAVEGSTIVVGAPRQIPSGSAYVFAQVSPGANEVRLTGPNNVLSWNSDTPRLAPVDCTGVGDGQLTCTGTVQSGGDVVTETGVSLDAVATRVLALQEFLGLYPPSAPPAVPPPALPPFAPWQENVTFRDFVPPDDPTIGVLASTGEVYFKPSPNSLSSTNDWTGKMAFPVQLVAPLPAAYLVRLYQRKGNTGDGAPFSNDPGSLCQHSQLDPVSYPNHADSFFICTSDPRSTQINPDPGAPDVSSCKVYHCCSDTAQSQTFVLPGGANTLWLVSREACSLALALSLTLDYHYTPVPLAPFRPLVPTIASGSYDPKVGIHDPSDPSGPYKLDNEVFFVGSELSAQGDSLVPGLASFPVQFVVPYTDTYVVNLDIRSGSNVFCGGSSSDCTNNDLCSTNTNHGFYICPTGATRSQSELNSECSPVLLNSARFTPFSGIMTAGVNTVWVFSHESCKLARIMHVRPSIPRDLPPANAFMSSPDHLYPASNCIGGYPPSIAQESSVGSCMTSPQTDPSITIDLGSIQDIEYVAVYVSSRTGRARLGHHTVSYLEDHVQWHLAPAGLSYCDYGDNAVVSECQVAGNQVAAEAGRTPERSMQQASENACNPSSANWDGIPDGCSVQTGTSDWSAHYRTSTTDCNGNHNYQLVCSEAYTECSSLTHMYDSNVEGDYDKIRYEFVHGCPARARYVKVTFPGYQPPYHAESGDSSAAGRVLELTKVRVYGPPLTGRRLDQRKATDLVEAEAQDATRLHRGLGGDPQYQGFASAKSIRTEQDDTTALGLIADQPDPTYTNVLFTDGELKLVSTASHDADSSRGGTLILWSDMPFPPWVMTARFQLGGQKNSNVCGFTSYHGPDNSVPHMELAIASRCSGDGSIGSVRFGTNHFGSALPSLKSTASRETCEPVPTACQNGWHRGLGSLSTLPCAR